MYNTQSHRFQKLDEILQGGRHYRLSVYVKKQIFKSQETLRYIVYLHFTKVLRRKINLHGQLQEFLVYINIILMWCGCGGRWRCGVGGQPVSITANQTPVRTSSPVSQQDIFARRLIYLLRISGLFPVPSECFLCTLARMFAASIYVFHFHF